MLLYASHPHPGRDPELSGIAACIAFPPNSTGRFMSGAVYPSWFGAYLT